MTLPIIAADKSSHRNFRSRTATSRNDSQFTLRQEVSEMILEDTVMYRRSAKTPEDVANWKLVCELIHPLDIETQLQRSLLNFQVYNFIIETKYFLEHYDNIIETWDLCDKEFLMLVWQIEELLTELLYKYTTVTTEFLRPVSLPTVEIKCCDVSLC